MDTRSRTIRTISEVNCSETTSKKCVSLKAKLLRNEERRNFVHKKRAITSTSRLKLYPR
jgi:hypothetical protein